jgi:hypothetical protein
VSIDSKSPLPVEGGLKSSDTDPFGITAIQVKSGSVSY